MTENSGNGPDRARRSGINRDKRFESRSYRTFKIEPENAGLTVEEFLRTKAGVSSRGFQKLTRTHGIYLNTRAAYSKQKLKAGDIVKAAMPADETFGVNPEPGPIEILYEDQSVIVLGKPAGQLVHPTGQTHGGTLANLLAFEFMRRGVVSTIRPVHRLDRDTTGCVIFAKSADVQTVLERQLAEGALKREYCALVKGVVEPAEGTIDLPIGPHPDLPNRRAVVPEGEPAVTHYATLKAYSRSTLVGLRLETGRTHQIRVHMAHLGHPVLGDRMYGGKSSFIGRQALHAQSVTFLNPIMGDEVTVRAPMPEDMEKAMTAIEGKGSELG